MEHDDVVNKLKVEVEGGRELHVAAADTPIDNQKKKKKQNGETKQHQNT